MHHAVQVPLRGDLGAPTVVQAGQALVIYVGLGIAGPDAKRILVVFPESASTTLLCGGVCFEGIFVTPFFVNIRNEFPASVSGEAFVHLTPLPPFEGPLLSFPGLFKVISIIDHEYIDGVDARTLRP